MVKRNCFCGCEQFRFKVHEIETHIPEGDIVEQTLFYNICRNCNHKLADHINIVRSKQAE